MRARIVGFGLVGFVLLACLEAAPAGAAAREVDSDAPQASPPAGRCSLDSIDGTYGFTFQGAALKSDGTHTAEFGGVGVETFDGHGTITSGRLIGTFNGQAFTPTFTGTYLINPDCTGTKTITFGGNGQTSHYAIILVNRARQIDTAETDPGTLLAFTQVRQ